MNYELCKKLKDMGFDQREIFMVYGEELDKYSIRSLVHRGVGHHITYDSSIGETLQDLRAKPVGDWHGRGRPSIYFGKKYLESEEGKELTVYVPTLTELIEACNPFMADDFGLGVENNDWICHYLYVGYFEHSEKFKDKDGLYDVWVEKSGQTSEEAVTHLWLALNTKEVKT